MRRELEFHFSLLSTYTYLAVNRAEEVAARSGVTLRWRPFNVRAIMREQNNSPFIGKPVKLAYMWRDLERRAAGSFCDFPKRPPYPLKNFDLANRLAVVGAAEDWCPDYVRATYSRWFGLGEEAGSEPNVSASLKEIGQDPRRVVPLAEADATGRAYEAATAEAKSLGIFGAPSFVARGELFWGDDRLEDAVRWHGKGTLVRR